MPDVTIIDGAGEVVLADIGANTRMTVGVGPGDIRADGTPEQIAFMTGWPKGGFTFTVHTRTAPTPVDIDALLAMSRPPWHPRAVTVLEFDGDTMPMWLDVDRAEGPGRVDRYMLSEIQTHCRHGMRPDERREARAGLWRRARA